MRRLIRFCLILGFASLTACGQAHHTVRHWPAKHYYAKGVTALKRGNYGETIRVLQGLEGTYPYGRYATQAQIVIAYAYYKSGDPDSAIAATKRFIRLHPTDARVPYAYYLMGLAEMNKNRSKIEHFFGVNQLRDRDSRGAHAALRAFAVIVDRYPHSRYAVDAAERMNYLVDMFARNNVAVARYYYNHGAYIATVNRCRVVIEHYQRTPAVADALGLMAMAYARLGLMGLSHDTARVLKLNYPHSPYLPKLKSAHVLSR